MNLRRRAAHSAQLVATLLVVGACAAHSTDPMAAGDAAPSSAPGGSPDAGRPDGRAADPAGPGDASASDAALPDAQVPDAATPDAAPARPACGPPEDVDRPIARLSQTGCVDPGQPLKAAEGFIFYDVASPLWSDAASKERWIMVPAGKKIRIKDCARQPQGCQDPELGSGGTYWDPGHFELPAGTVLLKHFAVAGKRIETRMITRRADGWGTYSYRWNEEQTEATVIDLDEGTVAREVANPALNPTNDPKITRAPAGKQVWTYPSRTDCRRCHTDEAGFQLGLDLLQLNTVISYPDGTRMNQLDFWQGRGLFETPPARPLPASLPAPTGTGSLESRARSYLHANCAHCHRPGGKFELLDLRWSTPLARTYTCNVTPTKGDLGVAGARRVVPGQPAQSLVSLRMHTLEERFRMPQIGSAVVDVPGAKLVDDWIASLPPGCPPPPAAP